MSIVIKDMEIPENERYVDVRIFADGRATTATGERPFYREMDVIELPPHGRLIDADRLNETMRGTLELLIKDTGLQEPYLFAAFSTLGEMVKDTPTILEAEVEDASS